MLSSVRAAGVDNLDVYSASLSDPASGVTHTGYKAVNIIGTVAAANLAESDFQAPSGSPLVDTDFDSLVIDEERAKGLLMFRLAECVTAIIIDERVMQRLNQDRIPYLDFVDPRSWIG